MSYSWLDEVLPDAVVVADEAQRITGFNPAAERLWGCAAAEVLGQPLATLIPTRLQRVHHEHVARFAGGAEPVRRMDRRVEVFGRRRDGHEFPCEVSIARRTTERGVDFVAVVRDLSDHRRAQRIAQLGDWTWDLVTGEQRWSPEARRILFGAGPEGVFNDCVHPDDRLFVGSTLQRALWGNAPWDLEHRVVHRDGTVRQVHQLAEVTRDAAERPLRLVGTVQDVTEVRRVQRSLLESEATVRALFEGARDAVVLLDPGHVVPSGGTLRIDGARTPGGRVRLTVSDTGAGFSEEVGRQLFEPFFTTKGPALGTGLGLATCHGIITEAGGTIVARSTPGQGAVFEVELPSPVAPLLRRAGKSPVPVLGGTERVLLVDDDARVRALLSRALQRAGYEVQVAATGAEALTCFARAPCQLVIADVVMPDLGGYALLARLREQAPALPVLLMTGYAAEPPPRDVAQLGQVEVLAKPFSVPELLQRARALLEAESTQEPEQVGA